MLPLLLKGFENYKNESKLMFVVGWESEVGMEDDNEGFQKIEMNQSHRVFTIRWKCCGNVGWD